MWTTKDSGSDEKSSRLAISRLRTCTGSHSSTTNLPANISLFFFKGLSQKQQQHPTSHFVPLQVEHTSAHPIFRMTSTVAHHFLALQGWIMYWSLFSVSTEPGLRASGLLASTFAPHVIAARFVMRLFDLPFIEPPFTTVFTAAARTVVLLDFYSMPERIQRISCEAPCFCKFLTLIFVKICSVHSSLSWLRLHNTKRTNRTFVVTERVCHKQYCTVFAWSRFFTLVRSDVFCVHLHVFISLRVYESTYLPTVWISPARPAPPASSASSRRTTRSRPAAPPSARVPVALAPLESSGAPGLWAAPAEAAAPVLPQVGQELGQAAFHQLLQDTQRKSR